MKIHTDFAANSLEWLMARAGVITASEADQFLTPKLEPRKGQMVETLLARKLAEKWAGPLPGFNTLEMEFGKILEEEAIPFYEVTYGETIDRVAFITSDDGKIGCSPDGLIGSYTGIEIKCCEPHTHVKYLLGNQVPSDHIAQVQFSLYVTKRESWRFMSYRRGFPALIVTMFPMADVQQRIGEALDAFLTRLDDGWKQLCEKNGGPPRSWKPVIQTPQPEPMDVIP